MLSPNFQLQNDNAEIDLVLNDGQFSDWVELLVLLRREFAHTQGKVSPPSTVYSCSAQDLAKRAKNEHLLLAYDGNLLVGCLFIKFEADHLFLGRFAIDGTYRSIGLARRMIYKASQMAQAANLKKLALETRVELTDNQTKFSALGFEITSGRSHSGTGPVTTYRMEKAL
jgi:ribosomal protein S18 acetylase RimI-like enzyme